MIQKEHINRKTRKNIIDINIEHTNINIVWLLIVLRATFCKMSFFGTKWHVFTAELIVEY